MLPFFWIRSEWPAPTRASRSCLITSWNKLPAFAHVFVFPWISSWSAAVAMVAQKTKRMMKAEWQFIVDVSPGAKLGVVLLDYLLHSTVCSRSRSFIMLRKPKLLQRACGWCKRRGREQGSHIPWRCNICMLLFMPFYLQELFLQLVVSRSTTKVLTKSIERGSNHLLFLSFLLGKPAMYKW